MSKTPQDFYNKYNGKAIDQDGVYGVQCVDGFKVFCQWAGIPVKTTGNKYASGYWLNRNKSGYAKYFDFITDKSKVKRGDWCIWPNNSSCPSSHIAMYWSGVNGSSAKFFGERQGTKKREFRLTTLKTDFYGAFRWKGWASTSTASTPHEVYYYVRKGDTLTKIASRYGTNVDKLVKLNGIKDKNKIYAGQRLRVS